MPEEAALRFCSGTGYLALHELCHESPAGLLGGLGFEEGSAAPLSPCPAASASAAVGSGGIS